MSATGQSFRRKHLFFRGIWSAQIWHRKLKAFDEIEAELESEVEAAA